MRRILIAAAVLMTTLGIMDAAAQAAGTFEWATHTGEAGTRRYKLFVPAGYDASRPAPLVVMLHGCTQNPDDFARGTRFNQAAAEAGALVAWPEQTSQHQPQKCWSWYDPAHQGAGGEPAIIAGITREVMRTHAVDSARVYIAGVSAGAAMAVNTAAAYPDLYAAVGSHSGIAYRAAGGVLPALGVMKTGAPDTAALVPALRGALNGRVMPLITIHGAADAVVAPVNSQQLASQWAEAHGLAAPDVEPAVEAFDTVRVRYDGPCEVPVVELLMVKALGHAWSGGSPEGTFTDPRGPDATREILRFLLSHRR